MQAHRKVKRVLYVVAAIACLAFPPLLLPFLIVLYVSMGGYGPSFATAAYGISLAPRVQDNHLPRSNSEKDDAELRRFLAERQQTRSLWWETSPLSLDEEDSFFDIVRRLDK